MQHVVGRNFSINIPAAIFASKTQRRRKPLRRSICHNQVMIPLTRLRPQSWLKPVPFLAIIIVCICSMRSFSLVRQTRSRMKNKCGEKRTNKMVIKKWKSHKVENRWWKTWGAEPHLQTCWWHASLACALFVQPGLHRKKCRSSACNGSCYSLLSFQQRAKGTQTSCCQWVGGMARMPERMGA